MTTIGIMCILCCLLLCLQGPFNPGGPDCKLSLFQGLRWFVGSFTQQISVKHLLCASEGESTGEAVVSVLACTGWGTLPLVPL